MNKFLKLYALSILAVLISDLCIAQSNWYYQNPLPQGNNLQGIHFVDDYIGTAVGDYGTIIRTTDGGLTWKKQQSHVTNFLYSVYFTDKDKGHVVGTAGKILRTTDGGDTWTNQTIGTITNHYSGVYFLNHNLGWIVGVGGTVLRTTNGGESWNLIFYGGAMDAWLQGVYFVDENIGIVTGNVEGTLRRTTDGGFTWINIVTGETDPFYKVTFTDKNNGFVVGGFSTGRVLSTKDGGITWDVQILGNTSLLYGVSFVNSNLGFATGNNGIIIRTTNGGLTWENLSSGTSSNLREIAIGKNNTRAYTVGGNGIICKTSDLGDTWDKSFSVTSNTLLQVSFSDFNHGTAVGIDGVIVRTTNSGFTWFQQNSGTSNHLRNVTSINNNIVIVVGDNGTIIKTTDGGENWFNQTSGVTMTIRSISFADENNGLAVGSTIVGAAGKIIKTTDGGDTWTIYPDVTGNLYGVSFPDINHATVVGQQGKIWRTNDGGLTWVLQSSPTNRNLNAVCFTDSNKGIAVGQIGQIIRTTDGGNTWALQTFGSTSTLNDVSFYNENFGIAVGTADGISTTVIRTTDGGLNWSRDSIDMWRIPSGVHCINEQSGVMVIGGATAGGAILRRGVPPLPSDPSNLFAVADTFFVDLNWSDNSNNENGFVIQRKIEDSSGNNSFAFLSSVGANINTYTDTGLTPNTTYHYRLYAYNQYGGSGFSNEIEVTTLPSATSTFQLSVSVTNGWNMVSIPGLHPTDQNVNTWWQYRDLGADVFKYLGGYQSVTDAVPGIGYWMKHSGDRTYNTGDEWPAGGIQIVAHDPLTAASGWNLFGGYELSVTAANVTTNPPGLQSGPIYKYSGGYAVATTLDPGYGYWIKLNAAGQIIVPETMAKGKVVEYFPENWGRIVLTDATGINYTLYAVKGEVNLDNYELPPAPPTGMFDIRFSSGRIAEDINSAIKTIDMNGVTYPLTIRVENMDIRLMDETGKNVNVNLKSGEDVVISDGIIQKLMVSGELIPAKYSLEQNYPNPFNPSTVIEFSLPENVGNVQLSIYNMLGEKVAELVNTALVAGKYQYQWNAQNVATGMYIYELRTDKFVSIKKMLLLK